MSHKMVWHWKCLFQKLIFVHNFFKYVKASKEKMLSKNWTCVVYMLYGSVHGSRRQSDSEIINGWTKTTMQMFLIN